MSPSKVLIPVDGSPASLRALDFAIEMARPSAGASLVLLNVQTISASEATSAAMGSDWQDTASRASAGALEQAVKKCEDGSIRFSTLIKTGLVAEAIARCLVTNASVTYGDARPRSFKVSSGSVAMKVVHLAEVPITLIK